MVKKNRLNCTMPSAFSKQTPATPPRSIVEPSCMQRSSSWCEEGGVVVNRGGGVMVAWEYLISACGIHTGGAKVGSYNEYS